MNLRLSRRRLYEGKAKIMFEGPEPHTLVQYFKDEVGTADQAFTGKGVLNNRISACLMSRLADIGIPTHFVRRLNMREQLVHEVDRIPVEIVVRSVAAGHFAKRFGIKEGDALPRNLVEFYLNDEELGKPMITEEHIALFDWSCPHELEEMVNLATRIHDFTAGLFAALDIRVFSSRLEFGRLWDNDEMRIVLSNEIGPDSCQLWDNRQKARLDRESCEGDQARLATVYQEIAARLGLQAEAKGQSNDSSILPFERKS